MTDQKSYLEERPQLQLCPVPASLASAGETETSQTRQRHPGRFHLKEHRSKPSHLALCGTQRPRIAEVKAIIQDQQTRDI